MKLTAPNIQRALHLVRAMHGAQMYGDHPYVDFHLIGVASMAASFPETKDIGYETVVITALLHDVIEDTPCTYDIIHGLFGAKIARAVALLSKPPKDDPSYNYAEYIKAILGNRLALVVKTADTMFNMNSSIRANNVERYKTYKKQMDLLIIP